MIISSGRYSRGRGRYIGWPYFYNLLVGPSYIPSPRPQPIDIDGWGMGKGLGTLFPTTKTLPHPPSPPKHKVF